jgi:hypothetical protein
VGIWLSRYDGGKRTVPIEVANGRQADGTRHPCWNPVLFQVAASLRDAKSSDESARGASGLLLFYKVGPSPRCGGACCGGRFRLIALIEDGSVIERMLRHLHLPTEAPTPRPGRAPPLLGACSLGHDPDVAVLNSSA